MEVNIGIMLIGASVWVTHFWLKSKNDLPSAPFERENDYLCGVVSGLILSSGLILVVTNL